MKSVKPTKNKIPIWLYKLPIVVVTAIVPLVLLIKAFNIPEPVQPVMGIGPVTLDLYHYYKMFFTVLMGILMLGILIYDIIKEPQPFKSFIHRNKYFYVISTLILMLVASSLASSYKYVVMWGFPDRYEGFLSIMTYYIISIYIPYIFRKIDLAISDILKYLMISGVVLSFIGILEYFGYRIVTQDWFSKIAKMTLNPALYGGDVKISFTFPPKTLASTLYNPNYVGSYMTMNIFATLAYISINKDKKYIKVCYGAVIMFVIALILSNSAAGLIGTVGAALAMAIFALLRTGKKKSVAITVAIISVLFVGSIVQELASPSPGIIRTAITSYNHYDESADYLYKNFNFGDNKLSITYNNTPIELEYDPVSLNVRLSDGNGQDLETYVVEGTSELKVSDPNYSDFSFTLLDSNTKGILKVGNLNLQVVFAPDGLGLLNSYGKVISRYEGVNSIGFKGYERIATNRGYLWSRSLPIIKDNLLLGIGPDCYAMEFPQDDIIGKVNFYDSQYVFVDKPHNLYIQTIINQGLISLVAFLILMFIPIFKLTRDLVLVPYKVSTSRSLLICSQISYMIAGLANDSTVSIGPVFWSIVGLNLYLMNKE